MDRDLLQQATCGADNFTNFPLVDKESATLAVFCMPLREQHGNYGLRKSMVHFPICVTPSCCTFLLQSVRFMSNGVIKLNVSDGIARFDIGDQESKSKSKGNKKEMSEKAIRKKRRKEKKSIKAKRSELRFYRLKSRKKLKSRNPEVRIKYKLEKAKRREAWLIEKLLKYELPKAQFQKHDPEPLTAEEWFYLKRMGQKRTNYVPVGVRGIFGGVILNMHLHWKKHETVKVICRPCRPGQINQYADEIARLSGGIAIDIKADNTIIFYRGKNYVQPEIMSPTNTLSKTKALDKYRFEQSLESVKQFIAVLEKELRDYHKHVALYGKAGDESSKTRSTKECNSSELNLVEDHKDVYTDSHRTLDNFRAGRLKGEKHGFYRSF